MSGDCAWRANLFQPFWRQTVLVAPPPQPAPTPPQGMRTQTYQVRWHWGSDTPIAPPVFAADFHHAEKSFTRLATAGADKSVKVSATLVFAVKY